AGRAVHCGVLLPRGDAVRVDDHAPLGLKERGCDAVRLELLRGRLRHPAQGRTVGDPGPFAPRLGQTFDGELVQVHDVDPLTRRVVGHELVDLVLEVRGQGPREAGEQHAPPTFARQPGGAVDGDDRL